MCFSKSIVDVLTSQSPLNLYVIDPKTMEILVDPLYWMPPLNFPEPEKHWRFKLRMFVCWMRSLPSRLRWTIFPYHVIHKDEYEELWG